MLTNLVLLSLIIDLYLKLVWEFRIEKKRRERLSYERKEMIRKEERRF